MKIGVISDTHIPDRAKIIPPKILEGFCGVDMIVHAGDFVDLEVLDKLKSVCGNVKAVWGNMDPYEVRKILSEKEIIEAGNFRIGLMHGYGNPNKLVDLITKEFHNDKINIIIFGHSHSPLNETSNGILYFNPGSPTDRVFSPYNSYGIIELGNTISAQIIKI